MMKAPLIKAPILFLAVFLCAQCVVYTSKVEEPLIDLPAIYPGAEETQSVPVGRWWEQFNDTRLNNLMAEAFRNNLDIRQAYERLQQSRAIFRITDSSRGFRAGVDASAGRGRQTAFLQGDTRTSPESRAPVLNSYELSIAAQYEVDLWGKLRSRARAAWLDTLASEESLRSFFVGISAQIADLYYLAAEQRAQLALSDRTIESFQDTLHRVERRYREGLVPALDVYQSRQNLASAQAQRPLVQMRLHETRNALAVLIGRFPGNEIGEELADLPGISKYNVGIPSQLLSGRPDVRASFLTLQASDARVAEAVADRFPSFSLTGSDGGTSGEVKSLLDSPNIFWNILLQAAQPVFDAGRRKAEVERTEAVFREDLALYHQQVLNAFREVEDALARITASEKRIIILEQTVGTADSSLRLATSRYMQGLTDYLPVLTEQLRHFSAQSNLLEARRQLLSDRISLARSLGGEWTGGVLMEHMNHKDTGEKRE